MSQGAEAFIRKLEELKAGDRAGLRQLAGQHLDRTVPGFDLFAGLWWPLREKNPQAPERRSAWLVAKLYGAFRLLNVQTYEAALPCVLRRLDQRLGADENARKRFRQRFDGLLCSPLAQLEPHLRWSLSATRQAIGQGREQGINWVVLLDDLRLWDRGLEYDRGSKEYRHVDIRDKWAKQYLKPWEKEVDTHVDRDSHDSKSQPGEPQS